MRNFDKKTINFIQKVCDLKDMIIFSNVQPSEIDFEISIIIRDYLKECLK